MPPMDEPSTIVRNLWDRIQQRNWVGVRELLADDLTVEWPASGELIVGGENFVRVQAEYPEGWSIRVLRIAAQGESVVSEVEVPHDPLGAVFRAASFWTVRGGLLVDGREYWTELGADPAPQWRAPYVRRV